MIEFREEELWVRVYHEGNPVLDLYKPEREDKYRMFFGATDDDDDLCLSRMSRLASSDLRRIANKIDELNAQL